MESFHRLVSVYYENKNKTLDDSPYFDYKEYHAI